MITRIKQWLANRRAIKQQRKEFIAAARKVEEDAKAKQLADDEAKLRAEVKEIRDSLVTAGFTPVSRGNFSLSSKFASFYAITPNKKIVCVNVGIRGAFTMEYIS